MIIGLGGFKGVGKSVVGDILANDFGFVPLSFAGHLKDVAALMFSWDREMLEGATNESREWREQPDAFWTREFGRTFTPREGLQKLGTEAARDVFHYDFWIIALKKKIQPGKNYVITDARFPNEIDFISDQHGFYVRIVRGDDPVWLDAAKEEIRMSVLEDRAINPKNVTDVYPEAHFSEWAVFARPLANHYQLENIGSMDALRANVQTMLKLFNGAP
jgi:hypothetical protein